MTLKELAEKLSNMYHNAPSGDNAKSCPKRTPVPAQSGHQFLSKADKDSWGKRTAGAVQSGQ